jgi:hypothetical protein
LRQENTVVVAVGLIAEDGDLEIVAVLQDLFEARDSSHPVAGHNELPFTEFAPVRHQRASLQDITPTGDVDWNQYVEAAALASSANGKANGAP